MYLCLQANDGIGAICLSRGLGDVYRIQIQYKHSKPEANGVVKVSKMNASVVLLESRLNSCGWVEHEWLFLWVSNRRIEVDVTPNKRLLWVGRDELANHAPLIGRRGLVPTELLHRNEVDE